MQKQVVLWKSLLAVAALAAMASAQPAPPSPSNPNYFTDELLCSAGGASPVDTALAARQDTVVSLPDADGFFKIFNGKDFKGWWQNCRSGHSSNNRTSGAIWRVDTVLQAIYSTQRGGNTGGLLSTKKRYHHYEVIFEQWAGTGNDGGFFHRNTVTGICYQTVLDYLGGASLGGTWWEGGGGISRDHRPFTFTGSGVNTVDSTISVPTGSVSWRTLTANRLTAGEAFDCPSTGCTQTEWRKHWKMGSAAGVTDGWNTVRIKFYGGATATQSLAAGADKVRMRSWFKSKLDPASRVDSIAWIPIWSDSMAYTSAQAALYGIANPIAFQVHGGASFPNPRGTWYRNVRIRELNDVGEPVPWTVSVNPGSSRRVQYNVKAVSNRLTGDIPHDYRIVVRDVSGRVLERFEGRAGGVEHVLGHKGRGLMLVEIRTAQGVQNLRVGRVSG